MLDILGGAGYLARARRGLAGCDLPYVMWSSWMMTVCSGHRKAPLDRSRPGHATSPARAAACAEELESRFLYATGNISFAPAQIYQHAATMAATADLDHDGLVDVVTPSSTRDSVDLFFNKGDGTLSLPPVRFGISNPRWVAINDFNGDGNPDIAVASPHNRDGRNEVELLYGRGDGTFFGPIRYFTGRAATTVTGADVNGDGQPDLVFTNRQRVSVRLNEGEQVFAAPVFYPAGPNIARSLSVGDFNQDGAPDLAVVRSDRQVDLLFGITDTAGHPTGTFSSRQPIVVGVHPAFGVTGDFNGDGKLDLAIANADFRVAPVGMLLGNGDGTFQPKRSLFGGNFVDAITTADFNGDGILDIATSSFTSSLRVYAGNGDGTFGPQTAFVGGRFGIFAISADFNSDGLPDILVANGPVFRILLNNSK
jgi:hypothetical protein